MALQYSTKRLDKELEQENVDSMIAIYQKSLDNSLWWLEKVIQERKYDQLIEKCLSLRSNHFRIADWLFASRGEHSKAKRHYYLAALSSVQAYRLVRAGFPYHMWEWAGPYNFKKNNLNFTKDAILANDLDLALSIAGEDTTEGLLIMEEYEKAQRIMPQDPAVIREETSLCCWAIAHQDQSVFNDALKERIKMLRRQGSHMVTVLDSWGLALIRLARRRGMTCDLNVVELPWKWLDDGPTDTTGLWFPFESELQKIICEKVENG